MKETKDLSEYREISVELDLTKTRIERCSFTGSFANLNSSRWWNLRPPQWIGSQTCSIHHPNAFRFAQQSIYVLHITSAGLTRSTAPKKWLSSQAQCDMEYLQAQIITLKHDLFTSSIVLPPGWGLSISLTSPFFYSELHNIIATRGTPWPEVAGNVARMAQARLNPPLHLVMAVISVSPPWLNPELSAYTN